MKRKIGYLPVLITASIFIIQGCKKYESPPECGGKTVTVTTQKVLVTGLNDPRGLKFGPDGNLYVAEAGIGGTNLSTTCAQVVAPVGPYLGSDTGSRISMIDRNGIRTTVADKLPSSITAPGGGSGIQGVADVAFVGNTLYGLLAGAGCSHGVPDIPNGVVKVHPDKTWSMVANLSEFIMANPVAHPNPADFEPDGTWFGMINSGGILYAIEPNHGEVDKVTPGGNISRLIDVSAYEGHIVPTCIVNHDGNFYVGNLDLFPIVQGSASVYKITPQGQISVYASGFETVLGVAFDADNRLYVLECTAGQDALTPGFGDIVRVDPSGQKTVIASGFHLPSAMTFGPDGSLYVSDWGIGPPGMGQIVQVSFKCENVQPDTKSY
ncbi:MAG TPA: ScyD/ScyE family protein [Hanamia sp.]